MKYALILISLVLAMTTRAQSYIYGKVNGDSVINIWEVKITSSAVRKTFHPDSAGNYQVPYVQGRRNTLRFEHDLCNTHTVQVPELEENETYKLNVRMYVQGYVVTATGKKDTEGVIMLPPRFNARPGFGDFIELVKGFLGVSSGNELSSQYNVRGGSYDENLIYVNDVEIYRPQLIRTGQQEGLSFVNPDLVNNLFFSAGGFEAKYGDKLSSVLDVQYRTPRKNASGFQLGLLGSSFFVDGVVKARKRVGVRDSTRLTFVLGGRYRGNKNLLNSLDAQGLYKSRFGDFQSFVTYRFNRFKRLELLLNYTQNRYRFEPEYQETTFGTLQSALKLSIGMDGQEIVDYRSGMGALSYIINKYGKELKFIASGYSSNESEHYDIQGAYQISEVDNNLGSSGFGSAKSLLGQGYFINHARNDLYFTVYNLSHTGNIKFKGFRNKRDTVTKMDGGRHRSRLQWGVKYQVEIIQDKFREWKYQDSSGYNINPFASVGDSSLKISEFISSRTNVLNHRYSGYGQYHQEMGSVNQWTVVSGVRYLYSTLNSQGLLSPRVQFYYEPNRKHNFLHRYDSGGRRKDIILKAAYGYYYQAPFYREMRNFDGVVNTSLQAQRSIHYTGGIEFGFKKYDRKVRGKDSVRSFKFTAEVYYKDLDYLVPYIMDNVRIRYYATNSARGYATGADMRVNGELIKGLESSFSLSILKTDEKITYVKNGTETETPFLRRPTDRRVSAFVMFQDELPSNPDYRVHLMLNFGSGLPYYLGGDARYKEGNTIPAYKRVDIGFSKILIGGKRTKLRSNTFESLWLGADVFNLLQINNVVSYLWVKDFSNNTYGVPNYLTGRRINIRLVGKF